jgi:two-component system, chemotaxis family, CheB/CheR fusion protein
VTTFHNLRLELEASNQELETANEELQSAHEELETTNEELQSTNEELETTNEELQSTNEELETMNEELRSTNEELEAMNAELKTISNDLNESNFFLHSILTSMNSVVIAIDHNFDIIAWNFKAQDIWGITEKEAVGCSLWELDTGLPVASLKQPLLDFISGKNDHCVTSLDGTSRRGKAVSVTVKMSRLKKLDGKKDGYLLIMDDQPNG